MRAAPALVVLAAMLLHVSPDARAHTRSVSYSSWTVTTDGASVRLKLSALDHNAIQAALQSADPAAMADYVTGRLVLLASDDACTPSADQLQRLAAGPGWVRIGWSVTCPAPPDAIRSELLHQVLPTHLHFARVELAGDRQEVLLSSDRPRAPIVSAAGTPVVTSGVGDYLVLGVTHILGGWDHLVFLFMLLAIAARVRHVALAVTGFTVGHSVSLALAATGVASPSSLVVEALVGLTIAWVAAENVWLSGGRRERAIPIGVVVATGAAAAAALFVGDVPARVLFGATLSVACYFALVARAAQPERSRWLVATIFGLIHGFAFASVLAEHELSGSALAWPLLGFNLGVELGQLAVVLVAWPLWLVVRRRASDQMSIQVASALAMGLGVYWFADRALF